MAARKRVQLLILGTVIATACTDRDPDPAGIAGDHQPSLAVVPADEIRDVPTLKISLPPELQPRDTSAAALVNDIAAHGGAAYVGFKSPSQPNTLRNEGVRRAIDRGTLRRALDALVDRGVQIEEYYTHFGSARVRLDPPLGPQLRDHPLIDFVEPPVGYEFHGTRMALNSRRSEALSDGSTLLAQTLPWGISMIRAPQANSRTTGYGAKLLVIDSGHDQGHEDLPAVPLSNCGGGNFSGCEDNFGHGTHVLGIASARNNSLGVRGAAPGISAGDVYMWNACASFACGTLDSLLVIDGIHQAISWGVDVVNMSFGSPTYSEQLALAVSSAFSADIVLVASAGNLWNTSQAVTRYPASFLEVIGVSGVKTDKNFADWSPCVNPFGWRAVSAYGMHVEFAAPFWALSTIPGDQYGDEDEDYCGTSMSAPHVSAVAAMIRSIKPDLPNYKVWDRLAGTAEDRGPSGWDDHYGYGIVDAYAATGPHVTIVGPRSAWSGQFCIWTADARGGHAPLYYYWYVNDTLVSTNSSYSRTVTSEFDLRLEVADKDNVRDSDWFRVTLASSGMGCGD